MGHPHTGNISTDIVVLMNFWNTLSQREAEVLERTICQQEVVVHAYQDQEDEDRLETKFLVLVNTSSCGVSTSTSVQFLVATQRGDLYQQHRLASLNTTQAVTVVTRCSLHTREEADNADLMSWLYLQ